MRNSGTLHLLNMRVHLNIFRRLGRQILRNFVIKFTFYLNIIVYNDHQYH